jgi:hypothetical protein
MKKCVFFLIFPFFSVILLTGYCYGLDLSGLQPPAPYGVFSTMSANSPEKGKAAVAFSVERAGEPDFSRFSTHLAYGITDNVELGISVPYVDNSETGLEDITFGIKHRFFDEGRYGPSIAYIVTVALSSGTDELSTDGSIGAGIAVSKRVGPVYGHANLFYSIPGNSSLEDEVRFSGGIDFSAAHDFRILGEVYGEKSHFSDDIDQLEARLGYRFLTGEGVFTTIGVGFDIDDGAPEYRLMVSITLHFPREEKPIEKVYEEDM